MSTGHMPIVIVAMKLKIYLSIYLSTWERQSTRRGSCRNWSVISPSIRDPFVSPARSISRTWREIWLDAGHLIEMYKLNLGSPENILQFLRQ